MGYFYDSDVDVSEDECDGCDVRCVSGCVMLVM